MRIELTSSGDVFSIHFVAQAGQDSLLLEELERRLLEAQNLGEGDYSWLASRFISVLESELQSEKIEATKDSSLWQDS